MPLCRDCGNKEYFTTIEQAVIKCRFDPKHPEDYARDSEMIDYLDSGTTEYECYECQSPNVSLGSDTLVVPTKVQENTFINGKIDLTKKA